MKTLTVRPEVLAAFLTGEKDIDVKTGYQREYRTWQPKNSDGTPFRGEILIRSNTQKVAGFTSRMAGVIVEIMDVNKVADQQVWQLKHVATVHPVRIDAGALTGFSEVDDALIVREPYNWLQHHDEEAALNVIFGWVGDYQSAHGLSEEDEIPRADIPADIVNLAKAYDAYRSDYLQFIHAPSEELIAQLQPMFEFED
ncbi:MAG TPA: hypothetical protein VGM95_07240 [Lactobacillaceae bacterium]|jgi:hypothetical protein